MLGPERLLELKEALLFGDPLDSAARLDLLQVIEALRAHRPRGRPATDVHTRAAIVGVLIEQHGVATKAALFAAAPHASAARRQSIERTYRSMRRSGEAIGVPAHLVKAALGTLGRRK